MSVEDIAARVKRMRSRASKRDAEMRDILKVRAGDIDALFPELFSEDLPKAMASNFIDVACRDLSELMAPLPTLEFNDQNATTQAAKNFGVKKTNIGYSYWHYSRLPQQMLTGADRYLTHGFLPLYVEPDFARQHPVMYALDPNGSYYSLDRDGSCLTFASVTTVVAEELADQFPSDRAAILMPPTPSYRKEDPNALLEVIRYVDKDQVVCYLPGRKNHVLAQAPNRLKRCPVAIIERPGPSGPRGQFQDAIPVQIARAIMARLGVDAAWQSVTAPTAVPDDVNELAYGPGAVVRSRNPEKIHRVGTELPPGALQTEGLLQDELRFGTRYPDARSGDIQASIVTGRGVQALQGTIDTQIKTAQLVFSEGLAQATAICLEMDEKFWPDRKRDIDFSWSGQAIHESYTPRKDIRGDYRVDCIYGFAAGLGVSQAVVMIAQLEGAGMIDRATGRRHLPLGEDPVKLERAMMVQQLSDGLVQGVTAMAQSVNVVVEQGGDPSSLLQKISAIIKRAQEGQAIEDIVAAAFPVPPPQPEQQPGAPGQPGQPGQPGGGGEGAPPGMSDLTGLPMGTAAPGQAPGGRPGLQQLLAGLSNSGKANIQDNVARRTPTLG